MLATTFAGFLVLRRAGRERLARFRVAVADTDVTGIEANTGGFLTVLAGLLLFLPGFLTDLVGAALLIAPVRRRCAARFRRRATAAARPRSVIDLAPDEWQQVPDRDAQDGDAGRDDAIGRPGSSCPAGGAVLATPPKLQRIRQFEGETMTMTANGGPAGGQPPASRHAAAAQGAGAIRQGFLVRESERAALAAEPAAAADQHPDQRQRQCAGAADNRRFEIELKIEGKAETGGTVLFSFELVFAGVFRMSERAAGAAAPADDDRMPAAAVPVRARDHRQRGAQRRLPAAAARSDRFRRALPAADGASRRQPPPTARRRRLRSARQAAIVRPLAGR